MGLVDRVKGVRFGSKIVGGSARVTEVRMPWVGPKLCTCAGLGGRVVSGCGVLGALGWFRCPIGSSWDGCFQCLNGSSWGECKFSGD